MSERTPLMVITTAQETIGAFFQRQLPFIASQGFEVHAVCSPGVGLDRVRDSGLVATHPVRMERKPHPVRDLTSLFTLWKLMLRVRPKIVHAHTPKAGLLGMIAATLAGVPVRLYTIHGLPLMTRHGAMRRLLATTESISCLLADRVYCVSPSLRQVVIEMGLCSSEKVVTLGDGTCSGIDLERYNPKVDHQARRAAFRNQYSIPQDAPLLTYVGRVARDKGIEVLAGAWAGVGRGVPAPALIPVWRLRSHRPGSHSRPRCVQATSARPIPGRMGA